MASITLTEQDVLIVVDVQYDFLPGGSLGAPGNDAVIAPINALGQKFAHVVLTQDWHGPGHISFASAHPGKRPFDTAALPYGEQIVWPDHCVQNSHGAALSEALDLPRAELVIRKGYHQEVDSYSAFLEADQTTTTGLGGYLRARGFTRVFVCGLATDFCVAWTAMDAQREGFETYVIEDASRGVDPGRIEAAWATMQAQGVGRIDSGSLA